MFVRNGQSDKPFGGGKWEMRQTLKNWNAEILKSETKADGGGPWCAPIAFILLWLPILVLHGAARRICDF
jgi:hypothetical protein